MLLFSYFFVCTQMPSQNIVVVNLFIKNLPYMYKASGCSGSGNGELLMDLSMILLLSWRRLGSCRNRNRNWFFILHSFFIFYLFIPLDIIFKSKVKLKEKKILCWEYLHLKHYRSFMWFIASFRNLTKEFLGRFYPKETEIQEINLTSLALAVYDLLKRLTTITTMETALLLSLLPPTTNTIPMQSF